MPYCLSCGKLRDTKNGFCLQCRSDMALRATADAHRESSLRRSLPENKTREEKDNGESKGRKGR